MIVLWSQLDYQAVHFGCQLLRLFRQPAGDLHTGNGCSFAIVHKGLSCRRSDGLSEGIFGCLRVFIRYRVL